MASKIIIGIDEVGRGCLAGPMTVAAILQQGRFNLRGIRDSKKLSAKKREEWNEKIKNQKLKNKNIDIAISSVSAEIIDKIGIARAAKLAVGKCLKKLTISYGIMAENCHILLDGSLYAPKIYKNQETIIKGDEKIPLISAASIVAKVYRDKIMTRFHKKFPQYGFDRHKGYGTKVHCIAIKGNGFSPLHRITFCSRIRI